MIEQREPRPFNALDAAYMGQRDYRRNRSLAAPGEFWARADIISRSKGLEIEDVPPGDIYGAYKRGFEKGEL